MIRRWILYLAILLGSIAFYIANQQWLGWLLVVAVLTLPLFGLLVSLPAMLCARASIRCAGILHPGDAEIPVIQLRCALPLPLYRGRIRVRRTTTGESWLLKEGEKLPTEHCGQLVCQPLKLFIFDYLGLFRLRVYRQQSASAIVRPVVSAVESLPDLDRYLSQSWKPKPGGGFSENHELRLYRPGDNLNQVHWKLTAKTGKLVIREAMEPQRGLVLLTMDLQGDPETLDRKFGQLQGMSAHLILQGLAHEIRVLTGSGLCTLPVTNETDLHKAIDRLLSQPPAAEGSVLNEQFIASWHCHIGGETHER